MFQRIMEFLGFSPPSDRPHANLSDDELVERYVRARLKMEDGGPTTEPKGELRRQCNRLMEEWEWRHGSLQEFDARTERLEERYRSEDGSGRP